MVTITLGEKRKESMHCCLCPSILICKFPVKRLSMCLVLVQVLLLISYAKLDKILPCEFQLINNYGASYLQGYLFSDLLRVVRKSNGIIYVKM